jgi:hypothetical protein
MFLMLVPAWKSARCFLSTASVVRARPAVAPKTLTYGQLLTLNPSTDD